MKPIERVSVADQVRDQILSWLFANLQPGARLPSERELSQTMGVSRNSVREVLQGLVTENILEAQQGGGYFVREIGPETLVQSSAFSLFFGYPGLDDLHGAREILEVTTAKLAARHASASEIRQIEELLGVTDHLVAEGKATHEFGWRFHEGVARASHNEVLLKLVKIIGFLVEASHRRAGAYAHYPWSYDVSAHRRIWQLIAKRDEEAAGQAMFRHLQDTYHLLEGRPLYN